MLYRPEHIPTTEDLLTTLMAHEWLAQVRALHISTGERGRVSIFTLPADFEQAAAATVDGPTWDHQRDRSKATVIIGQIRLWTEYNFSELPQSERNAAMAARLT